MAWRATATVRGPVLDGRSVRITDEGLREIRNDVALELGVEVVDQMQRHFRDPTPVYWTHVDVQEQGSTAIVTDQGKVPYNFWLAGRGSRNWPKTSFRGYPHWETARRRIGARVQAIATPAIRRMMGRLGGRP